MRIVQRPSGPLLATILAAVGIALFPGVALAQAPSTGFGLGAIKVPGAEKAKTGKGLAVGRSVFHVGLSVEAGWDSNVFYTESGSAVSSAYMRVLPQLTLGSRPVAKGKRQGFAYNLGLALDYVGYLQELPGDGNRNQIGAAFGADLKFDPKGIFSFNLVEQFVRTNEPRVGLDGTANRDYNQVGVDVGIDKGLLSFILGYRFIVDIFEDAAYRFGNRMLHEAKLKATWRFFPQTSFWFLAETGFVSYFGGTAQGGQPNSDSVPLRLWLGATGRLTHWLTADIGLGYGYAYYPDSTVTSYHNFIANVGVGFKIATTADLKLGYRRDFRDSLVGDLFRSDSAYVRLNIAVVQRLILQAVFAWTRADYQNYVIEGTTFSRIDNYLLGTVGADYYFLGWLSAGLGYTLMANVVSTNATYAGVPIDPNFAKHRVFGRVSIFY